MKPGEQHVPWDALKGRQWQPRRAGPGPHRRGPDLDLTPTHLPLGVGLPLITAGQRGVWEGWGSYNVSLGKSHCFIQDLCFVEIQYTPSTRSAGVYFIIMLVPVVSHNLVSLKEKKLKSESQHGSKVSSLQGVCNGMILFLKSGDPRGRQQR